MFRHSVFRSQFSNRLSFPVLWNQKNCSFSSSSSTNWTRVASVTDLSDEKVKGVEVDGRKILLSRTQGTFYATDFKCTHYGAPLDHGLFHKGVISCPWHNAKWSVKDGRILNAPAVDDLKTYPVKVEGDGVFVQVPSTGQVVPPSNSHFVSSSENRTFLIVGAGAAGTTAAETLRQEGFGGKIVLVSAEKEVSYDRPKLSKMVGLPFEKVVIRNDEWYRQNEISVLKGKSVSHLDLTTNQVSLSDGQSIASNSILLASGGKARTLAVPGSELGNIFTLRTFEDSENIRKTIENTKSAVILGSSFIGMEIATCLKKNHSNIESVTVVGMEKVPFERVMGSKFGELTLNAFQTLGVHFKMQRTAKQFKGSNQVESVVLDNGEELKADLVIIGAGINLTTEYLNRSGIELNKDGSVSVNQYLQVPNTKSKTLYAAGDIARFPYHGENIRVEHWAVAQQQGRVAAQNMLGKKMEYSEVPFFWSNSTVPFRYAGHASSFDDIIYQGDLHEMKFTTYYVKGDNVKAVATCGVSGASAAVELMRENRMPSATEIRKGVDLEQLLKRTE